MNLKSQIVFWFKPHCETTESTSEEEKEIIPAIKFLKKRKLRLMVHFS